MKKNTYGVTKQGVRDLSHLKGKSVGRVVELPPDTTLSCKHRPSGQDMYGNTRCLKCGATWDWDGNEF